MITEKAISVEKKWALPISKLENEHSERELAAWEAGKKEGVSELQRGLNTLMKTNLDVAWAITSDLIKVIKKKKVKRPLVKLRINNFDSFDILVLIPEDIFHSDESDSIYSAITKIENDCVDLNIHFSLIGENVNTDIELMDLEGFTYNYLYNEPRSRKS